jgi:hypothetical protein
MANFHAAATARKHTTTGATHNNGAQAWRRWEQYCKSVRSNNIYMVGLTRQEQILMLGAFAMAVRTGRFLREKYKLWLKAQSEVPFHICFGPSGRRADQIIPQRMQTMTLVSFSPPHSAHFELFWQKKNIECSLSLPAANQQNTSRIN